MNSQTGKVETIKSQSVAHASLMQQNDEPSFQFVDNRSETISQRKMQETINNGSRSKQLRGHQTIVDNYKSQVRQRKENAEEETLQGEFDPAKEKENSTGLPDKLKSGIENLSGYSMSDVKVHYNSDKPSQLQANAYAQGTDIHIASGQEKHLPHEVWHVVQQKQGRVEATMQMKDSLNINDDKRLENEVDIMGVNALTADNSSQALQMKGMNSSTPMQFAFKAFRSIDDVRKASVEGARQTIEDAVDLAYDLALNWTNLSEDGRPRVALWYQTANSYFNNPAAVPDFIYAQFGYAIETIACDSLPASINGLDVDFQVAAGHTRPDIVLRYQNTEVAWIDITSTGSEDHILGKQGAGWRTRPYVYEVFYNALDPKRILAGMRNPALAEAGGFMGDMNKIVNEEKDVQIKRLRDTLIDLQESKNWRTGYGNKKEKKSETRAALTETLGMNLGLFPNVAAKGALSLVDINYGPFGYSQGVQNQGVAAGWVTNEAQPEIEARQGDLRREKIEEVATDLEDDLLSYGLVLNWFNSINALTEDQNNVDWDADWQYDNASVTTGIAIKHAISKHEMLDPDPNQFGMHAANDLAIEYTTRVANHMHTLPIIPNFNTCKTYIDVAMDLIDLQPVVSATVDTQGDFDIYLYRKYGDFEEPTPEENQLRAALDNFPLNYDAQEAAANYLDEHPLEEAEEMDGIEVQEHYDDYGMGEHNW